MNFKSPPTMKRLMALLFRLISKYFSEFTHRTTMVMMVMTTMMMMTTMMIVMMVVMTMMTLRKLSFLWSAGAEMSHEGWVQNAHKDRLIYQACVVFTIISKDNIYLRT